MTRAFALVASLLGVAAGCGGSYPATQATPASPAAQAGPDRGHHGNLDIRKASMPYKVLRARGGQEVDQDAFFAELGRAAAVCLGESHSNPHDHWVQLHLFETVAERAQGKTLALGMEMFQRPFQGVLDDFAAGRIDEAALLSRTGWDERWGFDFALYRPIVELAVARNAALVALNIASELHHKAAHQGPDALTEAERARLPEVNLDDRDHRAWFADALRGAEHAHGMAHDHGDAHEHHGEDDHHGHGDGDGDGDDGDGDDGDGDDGDGDDGHGSIYLAQVLWDETMADTAARWLGGESDRQIVILAGNGHCHDSAMVRRLQRRGVAEVVSVRPILDHGNGNVAAELARPLTDYLLVMTPATKK